MTNKEILQHVLGANSTAEDEKALSVILDLGRADEIRSATEWMLENEIIVPKIGKFFQQRMKILKEEIDRFT